MKYKARWYNVDSVVHGQHDDDIIGGSSTEGATRKAYEREKGNPPALMLWLEEVK